jgi:anaerobic selenocysteine-containing dehydrogenase
VIISEKLHDADYVMKHTLGFDELRARVMEDIYSPENVAKLTGIPAADIIKLAREYATTHPAVIRVNYGVQRSENGGMAVRAITMLPCITGSWKDLGGGLQLSTSGSFPFNKDSLTRPDLMLKSPLQRAARIINMSELGRVLLNVTGPPIKAVFVYNSNPAAVAPNHNDVIKGFLRPDLFTVVHEQFFTDTTDYADVILPATTFFEHKELQGSYGHYYLQISNQAIAPLGEAKSNVEMFQLMALKMGFDQGPDGDIAFRQSLDEMIDGALKTDDPWFKGITRERLETEPQIRMNFSGDTDNNEAHNVPFRPFADGQFYTASGKAELYSESVKAMGLDPVASFVPPIESRHSKRAEQFPLELLGRKADNHLNSTFCNIPAHQKMEESHLLEISRADAAKRNIADGDQVRVFNSRGEIRLKARVDGAVREGVVASRLNWPSLTPGDQRRNINVLTAETLTEIGAGATFYSCLVEVEKV